MSKGGTSEPVGCFPGYKCTTKAETKCGTAQFSLNSENTCSATKDWITSPDIAAWDCPAESKRSTSRYMCD